MIVNYPLIDVPITDYKVVHEIFNITDKWILKNDQECTIKTFDLGVIMKGIPII